MRFNSKLKNTAYSLQGFIFAGKTMHTIHALIIDLTLITIYAGITTLICKKLKQPIVLGYVLAGIFAGPYFDLLPTVSDRENLSLWADIGVIFLLFGLGLEFSFKKMLNVGKSAMITANANILFMLFLGYYTGLLLGWSTTDSFFLGSMISMSSTTIIIKAFDDLNIKKQKFTDLVFGVLVIEDLVGILLLVLLPMVALGQSINGGELALSTFKLLSFLILCFVIGIYIVPTVLKKLTSFLNDEMLLLITVGMCFGMVWLATASGFSSALGAFLMGSVLSETGLIVRIENVVRPLKDFFGAVFFVSVGMMVDPAMFVTYAGPIAVVTLIVVVGKVVFSCFGFVISGQSLRTSTECAFSLAQVGEFAFIIAALGMSLGVLDGQVYPVIVAVSVITTFLTPVMIRSAGPVYRLIERKLPASWSRYINKASAARAPSRSEERLWSVLFKNYAVRIILFSIILFAIIGFCTQFVRPYVRMALPGLTGRIVMTMIAFVLVSPFLKALIGWEIVLPSFIRSFADFLPARRRRKFLETREEESAAAAEERPASRPRPAEDKSSLIDNLLGENAESLKSFFVSNAQAAKIYYQLWRSKKANRLPLIVLTSFRLLVVAFFIVTVVHQFLTENQKVTLILLVASVALISRSKWLLSQYLKMEAQFLDNLKGSAPEKDDISGAEEKMLKFKIMLVVFIALVYYGVTYCILSPGICKYYADYYLLSARSFSIDEERDFLRKPITETTNYFRTYRFDGQNRNFKMLGFARFDDRGIWSIGNMVRMSFRLPQVYSSVWLDFEIDPYVNKKNENVFAEVYLDDRKIDEWNFQYGRKMPKTRIKIARKYLSSEYPVNLIFKIDGAVSPKSLGFGQENRKFGLIFNSLTITPDD